MTLYLGTGDTFSHECDHSEFPQFMTKW